MRRHILIIYIILCTYKKSDHHLEKSAATCPGIVAGIGQTEKRFITEVSQKKHVMEIVLHVHYTLQYHVS